VVTFSHMATKIHHDHGRSREAAVARLGHYLSSRWRVVVPPLRRPGAAIAAALV
jgi:hypothetical protein